MIKKIKEVAKWNSALRSAGTISIVRLQLTIASVFWVTYVLFKSRGMFFLPVSTADLQVHFTNKKSSQFLLVLHINNNRGCVRGTVVSQSPGPWRSKGFSSLLKAKKKIKKALIIQCHKDMVRDEVEEGDLPFFCHCFLLPLFSGAEQGFQGLCTSRAEQRETFPQLHLFYSMQ